MMIAIGKWPTKKDAQPPAGSAEDLDFGRDVSDEAHLLTSTIF